MIPPPQIPEDLVVMYDKENSFFGRHVWAFEEAADNEDKRTGMCIFIIASVQGMANSW
jgi:hypothetical protein